MSSQRASIAAAVIVQDGHVLLGRHVDAARGVEWQLPGGKIKFGENPEEGAAREAVEEVGLEVAPTCRLGERIHPVTGWHVIYVACRVVDGLARPTNHELSEVAWCTLADLPTYVRLGFYGPVQAYLDAALEP